MLKTFSVWLEEYNKKKRIEKQLMDRLFPNADVDPSEIKIKGLKMLPKAIDELGIEDDHTVDDLKNWIPNNQGATLTQFFAMLNPDDVPDQAPLHGDKAQLPPEQDQQPDQQPPEQPQQPGMDMDPQQLPQPAMPQQQPQFRPKPKRIM
jgi:hypothetical protein